MVVRTVEYTIVVSSLGRGTTSCGEESSVHCPFCSSDESKVVDSRDSESGDAIRRRRECLACERRYTTYERLEEVPLVVVKRSGSEEVFARQKLLNGLLRATEKRAIPIERLERAVDDIENELRHVPGQRVTTKMGGERARLELAGAAPLPGEEPLPGIEAEIDALTTSTFTEPPQAVATGGDKGHD